MIDTIRSSMASSQVMQTAARGALAGGVNGAREPHGATEQRLLKLAERPLAEAAQ